MWPRIARLGEDAWLVAYEPRFDVEINAQVLALAERVTSIDATWVREVVPAAASLAVHVDPDGVQPSVVEQTLRRLASEPVTPRGPGRLHEIPVCYDPALGPDLDAVAAWGSCSVEEVASRHAALEYRVFMVGFLPGFAYLGMVDPAIAMPRRDSPRVRVPAGSVGLASRQTGVYPVESPGGWQIIGRTATRMFDVSAPDAGLRAGDRVRFVPIGMAEFAAAAARGVHT